MLFSSGMKLSKRIEAIGAHTGVTYLKAIFTNMPGISDLQWKRVNHAKLYNAYISANNGRTWNFVDISWQSKFRCKGLEKLKRYYFKVIACKVHGESPEGSVVSQVSG